MKLSSEELIPSLQLLFNRIIEEELTASQWNEAEIILFLKKGDKRKLENYRPLSLSADVRKVFMKLLKNRMYDQPIEQAGFRRGYSTIDHIHTMSQLIEKSGEYNLESHLVFINFRKAFDTLRHESLIKALVERGTNERSIKLIKKVYENASAHIQIKLDKRGETFRIKRSPNLFDAVLEWIFKKLDWEGVELNIDGVELN